MNDTIKRENAINTLLRMDGTKIDKALAIGEIRSLPSADKSQGEWITINWYIKGEAKIAVRCSECKCVPLWLGSPILPTNCGNLNYCPHCGCRMKGKDNGE